MKIPIVMGQPLHLWLGVISVFIIIFQISIAKKILPLPFRWHRIMGYVLLLLVIIHGSIAIGLSAGIFSF